MISSKIDIRNVVREHINSLKDGKNKHYSIKDLFSFYGIPTLMAIIFYFSISKIDQDLTNQIDNILVASFSIFAAMLLNAQVLIISLKDKYNLSGKQVHQNMSPEDISLNNKHTKEKNQHLSELFANVSYSILISIILVVFTLCFVFFKISSFPLIKAIQFFGVFHFCATGLMVIKRMHVIFSNQ